MTRLLQIEDEQVGEAVVLRFRHERLSPGLPINTYITGRVRVGAKQVVADLSEVAWIDPKVAEGLIVTMLHVDDLGGEMCCAGVREEVREAFRALGLDPFPPVWMADSVDEALSALSEA